MDVFYNLFIWIESMDVLYNLFIWIEYIDVFFIICWYEWNMWMLSVLFVCMNGISECFLYCFYINGIYACLLCRLFTYMEFSDVLFAINLCELNMRMLSFLFVYMNGTCECYLYCLLIWMESVNVFFIVFISMEFMFTLSFAYINGIFGCFLRH
jgi:hypothetical protein